VTLVDLSHPIRSGQTTYPGLPAPTVSTHLSREASRGTYAEGTEFHIGRIDMVSNTGTYMDAPFHRYPDGADIASLALERLCGVPGVVVRVRDQTAIGPEAFLAADVAGHAVLVHTGWDSHFGQPDYLGGHPHLTDAAAAALRDRGAVVVGIDSANIDSIAAGTRPAHTILLAAGIPIIEHMTNLGALPEGQPFEFFAIPAPVVGMGTFPVRAVARL